MKPLSRRTVIRGTGGIAISLPFLDAMVAPRKASAQTATKRLFLMVGQNGVVPNGWFPSSGTETNFELNTAMKPLEPHKANLIILDGVNKMTRGLGPDGTAHGRGSAGALTGHTSSGKNGIADGPSIDHPISEKIGVGTRIRKLVVGRSNAYGFFHSGPRQKVFGEDSPQANYTAVFSNFDPGSGGGGGGTSPGPTAEEIAKIRARQKSVIDGSLDEFNKLLGKVGPSDKRRLDIHAEAIRQVERGLDALNQGGGASTPSASCTKPAGAGDSSDFPKKMTANLDIACLAMACDVTRIAGAQYNTHGQSFAWAGMRGGDHHALAHQQGSGGIDGNLIKANTWMCEQMAHVVTKLKSYGDGAGSVFDNTFVMYTNELAIGPHKFNRGPFLIAAGNMPVAGGKTLQTGRWLKYDGFPHTGVLISIGQIFDLPMTEFGFGQWQKGPLPGLI